jgi:hypothetical protein
VVRPPGGRAGGRPDRPDPRPPRDGPRGGGGPAPAQPPVPLRGDGRRLAHERTASNIAAAETDLLRLAPDDYVCGQMPSLLAHVRAHLPLGDPRHARMEELAVISRHRTLSPVERNILVSVVRASQSEARREVMRVRSFRNVLYIATALMTLAANALRRPACARRARSGGQPDDAGRAPRRTAHLHRHDELAG